MKAGNMKMGVSAQDMIEKKPKTEKPTKRK